MSASIDTQELIVSSFLKGDSPSNLYSQVHRELSDEYFSDPSCKMIYKAVQSHYTKYLKLPTYRDVLVRLDAVYVDRYGIPLEDIKRNAERLVSIEDSDPTVIRDILQNFIRDFRIHKSFQDLIEKLKYNPNLEYTDTLHQTLTKGLDLDLSTEQVESLTADTFMKAKKDALGSEGVPDTIKSIMPSINNAMVAGGWVKGTLNMLVGPPAAGKSMWLFMESGHALKQGFRVLHILIGDLTQFDGVARYLSVFSGLDQRTVLTMSRERVENTIRLVNQQYDNALDRCHVIAYPSYSVKVEDMVNNVQRIERQNGIDYDMIIVDYPDNLLRPQSSMYEEGGVIYGFLEKLAKTCRAVVLVASQPKQEYWDAEIIPLKGAAESSRKQHAVDTMLAMNLHARDANFGTIYSPKSRRGIQGKIMRIKTDYDRCYVEEITETEYKQMLTDYNNAHRASNAGMGGNP